MWNGALSVFNETKHHAHGAPPAVTLSTIPHRGIHYVSDTPIPACPLAIPTGQSIAGADFP